MRVMSTEIHKIFVKCFHSPFYSLLLSTHEFTSSLLHFFLYTGVLMLARGCPLLIHINLTGVIQLTDVGCRGLTASCDQLRTLVVSGCSLLTDASMRFLPKNCPSLQLLNISGCTKLTDVTFFVVLDNYQLENGNSNSKTFQKFIITGCTLMGVNEYGVCEQLNKLRIQYNSVDIVCNGFGTEMKSNDEQNKKGKSKILKRFPENLKRAGFGKGLKDRAVLFAKKVVGKGGKGGGKKKKGGRKKKK